MHQYTPGPWTCTQTSNHAHDYRLGIPGAQMPFEGNDVARANARLIAAAPDLLETLGEAAAYLHAHKHTLGAYAICDKVDAVIAKAEGTAP